MRVTYSPGQINYLIERLNEACLEQWDMPLPGRGGVSYDLGPGDMKEIVDFVHFLESLVSGNETEIVHDSSSTVRYGMHLPIESMPLYINDTNWLKRTVAKWRLECSI